MKRLSVLLIAGAVISLIAAGAAQAQEKAATPAQARELLKKTVAYAKEAGCEKAFAEINKGSMFKIYRNAYPTAGDLSGVTQANGRYPFLVGQNHADVKDTDGKPFMRMAIEKRKKGETGTISYKWKDSKTNKIETRTVLVGETMNCGQRGIVGFSVTYEGKI